MFTSRAEHRLLLRQDNADQRLMRHAAEMDLIESDDYAAMQERYGRIELVKKRFFSTGLKATDSYYAALRRRGAPIPKSLPGKDVASFLRRPEIKIEDCVGMVEGLEQLQQAEAAALEIEIKYEGYVRREQENIHRRASLAAMVIPDGFDYAAVTGLKKEAREKLMRVRPANIAAAAGISGVDPSDIDLIYLYLR